MSFVVKYIRFYKLLVFLFALFFWFNPSLVGAQTSIEVGCLKTNGSCEKINVTGFSVASEQCVAQYGSGTREILEGCNNYGCVGLTGVCIPITASDWVEGQRICDNLDSAGDEFSALPCNRREQEWGCEKPDGTCVDIKDVDVISAGKKCAAEYGAGSIQHLMPCGVERPYACFKQSDDDCVVVEANTQYRASTLCKERCTGTNLSCYVKFELAACPDNPAEGTSLVGLQSSAESILNKAKLSSPASLIKRFIIMIFYHDFCR